MANRNVKKFVFAAILAAFAMVTVYSAKSLALPGTPISPPSCKTPPCH